MTHLITRLPVRSTASSSPIGFVRKGGGSWKEWDRFMTLDGKPAYHVGNICNTCAFFFERLEGANRSIEFESVVSALTAGLGDLTRGFSEKVAQLLPEGEYEACLLTCEPTRTRPGETDDYFAHEQTDLFGVDTFWDLPHDPRTEYYRVGARALTPAHQLFEFLVPMFPARWLKPEIVANYVAALADGAMPTAVAISILDVKGPAEPEGVVEQHFCLSHYLLDGHHKVLAAAQTGRPLGLISLLARDQGICDEGDLDVVLSALAEQAD